MSAPAPESTPIWRHTADLYRRAGWSCPLPLPAGVKWPPPTGFTGWEGKTPTTEDLDRWARDSKYHNGNIALRMPPVVLGIDVDNYGDKIGLRSITELQEQLGALPATWQSSSRADLSSGIRFYRVPPKLAWPGKIGPDIEAIHLGHRYAVVSPSIHPEGGIYQWYDPRGLRANRVPTIGELPMLPEAWIQHFTSGEEATPSTKADVSQSAAYDWIRERQGDGEMCQCVNELDDRLLEAIDGDSGSRHDTVRELLVPMARLAERGCHDVYRTLVYARDAYALATGRGRGEFDRMLAGAVAIVMGNPRPDRHCPAGWLDSLPVSAPSTTSEVPTEPVAEVDFDHALSRLNWQHLWDDESEEEWVIEPLLAVGRSVALYSAPKVGKSLLALDIAAAVASGRPVLGMSPTPRVVLYVDFENDPKGDIRPRLKAMGHSPESLHRLVYLSFPVLGGGLDTVKGASVLLAAVEHYEAEVVIVDTVSRAIEGEENVNDTWLALYRNLGVALKRHRVAILRLDHSGKDDTKGMRGGSAKYGDVDAVWKLSLSGQDDDGRDVLRLANEATRMPITEKVVAITRAGVSKLNHTVNPGGRAAAFGARVTEIVTVLNEQGAPLDIGRTVANKILKEALGKGAGSDYIDKALEVRRQAANLPLRPQAGHFLEAASGDTGSEEAE